MKATAWPLKYCHGEDAHPVGLRSNMTLEAFWSISMLQPCEQVTQDCDQLSVGDDCGMCLLSS